MEKSTTIKGCTHIYAPAGQAGEYSALACNPYRGCGHACAYCYVPAVIHMTRAEFDKGAELKPDFIEKLRKDAKKYQAAGIAEQVMLSFTSDPYHLNDTTPTREVLQILRDHGLGFCTLSKGGSRALRDLDLFRPNRDAYAATLTGLDDAFSTKWERFAALPGDRIATLKGFYDAGIFTWVSLEPTLDIDASLAVIRATHEFVDLYKVGRANYCGSLTTTTDWEGYTHRIVDLKEELGLNLYIKKDLQPFLPEGYHNPLRIDQFHPLTGGVAVQMLEIPPVAAITKPSDTVAGPELVATCDSSLPDDSPAAIEERLHDLLRHEGRDKRANLWTITFPLAETWALHEQIIRGNGVLKQYGGKRKYVPIKFGRSYDVINKAENAAKYKDRALDGMQWLDQGCTGFHTDPGWHDWHPRKVYGPEWIVEVCEAFTNRHEPPPIKEPAKPPPTTPTVSDDDEQPDVPGPFVAATSAKIRELESKLAESVNHREEALAYQAQEVNDLDQKVLDLQERIRLLEHILREHHIEIPFSQPLTDMLDGLNDDEPPDDPEPPAKAPGPVPEAEVSSEDGEQPVNAPQATATAPEKPSEAAMGSQPIESMATRPKLLDAPTSIGKGSGTASEAQRLLDTPLNEAGGDDDQYITLERQQRLSQRTGRRMTPEAITYRQICFGIIGRIRQLDADAVEEKVVAFLEKQRSNSFWAEPGYSATPRIFLDAATALMKQKAEPPKSAEQKIAYAEAQMVAWRKKKGTR